MDGKPGDGWEEELERWLGPFLDRLRRQAQRGWAPVYLRGLLLPGERKSVEPMAARVAPGDTQQLHPWQRRCQASRPRPGLQPLSRRSWCGPSTDWWAGRTRCWSWTTPRW